MLMSPSLATALKKHKLQAQPNVQDLIFANGAGKVVAPDNLVRRHFHPALRRAGLRRVRFHDLKHTFATLLISQGENIKFIQLQLGHVSVQTTLDRYGHLLPESHHEAGNRIDETLGIKGESTGSVRRLLESSLEIKKGATTNAVTP